MAITDKEQGVWETDQVYNKIMEGGIWTYDAVDPFQNQYNSKYHLDLFYYKPGLHSKHLVP